MVPYYVMLVIIIVCVFREENLKCEIDKKRNFLFALLPVFVLIAFKAETIGSDTIHYLRSYEALVQYGRFDSLDDFGYERIELGYKYFILVLSSIFKHPQFLLIALALITCSALYYFIVNNAKNRSLALYLFVTLGFFQFAMSGIRQTIAISIVMFTYKFIKKKKIWWFLSMIFLAIQFHKSAIIFAPSYFIAHMHMNKSKISVMFIGMFVLLLVADRLLLTAADVMNYNYGIESTGNGYIFFVIVVLITFLCLRYRNQLISLKKSNSIMININFISLALWIVRLISRTAERVSLYFMPYTYIALEEYLSTRPRMQKTVYMFIAIVLSTYLCIHRLSGQVEFVEFKFFFQ